MEIYGKSLKIIILKKFLFYLYPNTINRDLMISIKKIIFLSALSFFSMLQMFAEPLCTMREFSYNDGMPHNSVTGIIQDKNGLIWISTWNGISSYDGYMFNNYRPHPGDGCTMMNSRIIGIKENSCGDIWCLNQDRKAYLFDVNKRRFIDFIQNSDTDNGMVNEIYPLQKGVTWIVNKDNSCYRIKDDAVKVSGNVDNESIIRFSKSNGKLKWCVVYNIMQDSYGNEWILTDKGVMIYGGKKFGCNLPFNLSVEIDKTIWLATYDGRLVKYRLDIGKLEYVALPGDVRHIYILEKTRNSKLAVGTDAGLILIDCNNDRYKQINVKVQQNDSNVVYKIFSDTYGDFWLMGINPELIHVSGNKVDLLQTPDIYNEEIKTNNRYFIFENQNGQIWVVLRKKELCYYDRKDNKLKYASENVNGQTKPILPQERACLVDRFGNLWTGSNKAFYRISFFEKKFRLDKINNEETEIKSLYLDSKKRLWVSSKDGVVKILNKSRELIGYLNSDGSIVRNKTFFNSNVYDIKEDNEGNFWLGTKKNGLFLLKPINEFLFKIKHYSKDDNDIYSLSGESVYSITQDSKNRIWIGTYEGGLNLVEKKKDGSLIFLNRVNRLINYPKSFAESVRYITEVNGDVILVGTTDGLFSFSNNFRSPEDIKFYHNFRKANSLTSLSSNDVMYIFTDSRNDTYVITQNAGVDKIISNNLLSDKIVFQVINEKSGLGSDLTRTMIEDKNGILWIVSMNLISRFNPVNKEFDHFGSYAFKNNLTFSESSVSTLVNGDICIGTNLGLFSFDPDKLKKNRFAPPIIFTKLTIQGIDYVEDPERIEQLTLKSTQRNITFHFAALDYKGSEEIKYAYMLDGVDNTWHVEGSNRSAAYLNLPHGKYTFIVKSTNGDGVWVNNLKKLKIEVLPTFWETPLAILLIIFTIIIIVVIVVYVLFTIFRLRHEVDIEQQMSDIKLKFFTDISHELRTPLTLISCPLSEVIDNEQLSDKARQHLNIVQNNINRLLILVNQILDFRKIQNKKMKILVEEIDVVALLRKIICNFKVIAEEKSIKLNLETNEKTVYLWIDKDKFEKIIFNLLSNAFKFTNNNKSISIRVEPEAEIVTIEIIDEGVGIPENKINSIFERFESLADHDIQQYSSGIGLSLVKELVNLHHGKIEVKSQLGVGSVFKIRFYKGRAHFEEDDQAELIMSDVENRYLGEDKKIDQNDIYEDQSEDNAISTILIVEDNKEMLFFLRDILSKEYRVVTSINGLEGLEKAKDVIPDIIVSDLIMPEMDGMEMIKNIKNNKDICHIPIIILSAKASLDDKIIGLESGIDDYITKPFSASYLLTRIKSLLNQRKVLQEAFLSSLSVFSPSKSNNDDMKINMKPSEPQISSYDEQFVGQLMSIIEKNMDNAALTVDDLAFSLSLSRTVFYKKIKSLFGISPVDLIKDIRVKRAVQLIEIGGFSLSEIAYMSGFSDPNYFGKCFKKKFGVSPSRYKDTVSPS
jgi:signal transduction histidine kinase/DNA-binding response OmpR family regulator/ligand-binding sensor domain-containing protein